MAGRIKLKSLATFSRQVAISVRAGLTLSRAFPIILRESRDRNLRRTFTEINADISEGNTLSEALRKREKRFPPMFVEMIEAGEDSGRLEEVFKRLADYFDIRLKLKRATIKASIYPMIQLTMAYAVFCLIMIVLSSDKFAKAWSIFYGTVAAIIVIYAVFFFFSRTALGQAIRDHVVLWIPLLRSVSIKLCMARFTRTLAMQVESAIPIVKALEASALVAGNRTVAKSLRRMVNPVRHGATLAEAAAKSPLVTPMVREVLAVGEETGSISEALDRVADLYEEESLVVLESIPKFIAPVVAIIVGLVVVYLFYVVYFLNYIKPMLESVGM